MTEATQDHSERGEPLIVRSADATNYLCETIPGSRHVWHHREMGCYKTQISVWRWHDLSKAVTGLCIGAHTDAFNMQVSITAAEARELATALTQAAFELELAQAEAAKVAV